MKRARIRVFTKDHENLHTSSIRQLKNNYLHMKLRIFSVFLVLTIATNSIAQNSHSPQDSLSGASQATYKNPKLPIEDRVADLLKRMTLEEKVNYLNGGRLSNEQEAIPGIKRLGVPDFIVAHGPFGMKIRELVDGKVKQRIGTYFPVSIAMAASWNEKMVDEIASAIGQEMNAVGAHANAGPAMNIIRNPLTGRSFEYFSEDPFLTGKVAAAYTRGLQNQKVAAILKHYACNNQELNRHEINVSIDLKALHEIYLDGFREAVVQGDAKVIMGAYNKVNGVFSCENSYLLTDVLRNEWGFKGFVLSDWSGTQSTAAAANSGMDVEMPRVQWYGAKLLAAVKDGKVLESTIDTMVGNVLRVVFWCGVFDQGPLFKKDVIRSNEHLAVARRASMESMVLLKNDSKVLPLDLSKMKKIAVIGPNADYGKHFRNGKYHVGLLQGGGSASLNALQSSMVTPFAGLKNNAAEGVEVSYAPGCYAESGCGEIPVKYLKSMDGMTPGMSLSYFGNDKFEGKPIKEEITRKFSYLWQGELDIPEAGLNMDNKNRFSLQFKSKLTAPATREYTFEVRNEGGFAQLFINGKLLAENKDGNRVFWNDMGTIKLEKGKEYDLEIRFAKKGERADLTFGWDFENDQYLEEAKALAKKSDAVILTVGLSGQMGETEAGDRRRLELYPAQEKLINEISKVNKNCAVVLIAGSAIAMDHWLDKVPAVLCAWYPGEQGGNAISDIIYGKANPSGRLPITFPNSVDQYPSDIYSLTDSTNYKEGIYVGYRFFNKEKLKPLFPFGFGLSYTSFAYSNLRFSKTKFKKEESTTVSVDVTNTGVVEGADVVQLYIHDMESSVPTVEIALKGFKKLSLKPNETKTVSFELGPNELSLWNNEIKKVVEPGKFSVQIGKSSENLVLKEMIEVY